MKKIAILLITIVAISGCSENIVENKLLSSTVETSEWKAENDIHETTIRDEEKEFYVPVQQLPEIYTIEMAINNGDYVNIHNQISNKESMNDFISKALNFEEAFVRTVSITIEGDILIIDFIYDTETYYVIIDQSRDQYAGSDDPFIKKEYKNLVQYTDKEGISYYITNLESISNDDLKNGFEGFELILMGE